MSQLDYAYPVTRIRARETRLLGRSRINRMLEADSADEMLKVLSETEYGSHVVELGEDGDFEELLRAERRRVHGLIMELIPDARVRRLFTLPYDIQNLKVLLKARFGAAELREELLNELGEVPPAELREILESERLSELESPLRGIVERGLQLPEAEREAQSVDIMLDKFLLERLVEIAAGVKSKFTTGYYRRRIDLLNVQIFIRATAMGKDRKFLTRALVEGGTLDREPLLENFGEPVTVLNDLLGMSAYAETIREGLQYWEEHGSLVRLEKLAEDQLMSYLRGAKFIAFGPEPLLGYFLAKESEIKTLRIIFTGHTNDLPQRIIRERVRDLYV